MSNHDNTFLHALARKETWMLMCSLSFFPLFLLRTCAAAIVDLCDLIIPNESPPDPKE